MTETVYIETTIPSLYVAKTSGRLVEAGRQRLTRIWWDEHRADYNLVCSQTVLDECGSGDSEMAEKRIALLESLPLLDLSREVLTIAQELVDRVIIPEKAADDAIHISVAAVHRIDYLITWNCKHIANPHIQNRIRACFEEYTLDIPVICTPEEFIGDDSDIEN